MSRASRSSLNEEPPTFRKSNSLYTNIRRIGKGTYGKVYLVSHEEVTRSAGKSRKKKDKKLFVLKRIDLKKAKPKQRIEAQQEAQLLSQLQHPNIVGYQDSYEMDGFLHIVMTYCECGDMYTHLKELSGVYLDETQIKKGHKTLYLHQRKILHRDLKTQNIFLTRHNIIKLGDLGIAKVLDENTEMATTLIGTPFYMSPELFSNKPYNSKSDIWALGCCIYEMATLKHAFHARDWQSLVYKILRGQMPTMPKHYSKRLQDLIRSMLSMEPKYRPSAREILASPFIQESIRQFLQQHQKETSPPWTNASSPPDKLENPVKSAEKVKTAAVEDGKTVFSQKQSSSESSQDCQSTLKAEQPAPSKPTAAPAKDPTLPPKSPIVGHGSSARRRRREKMGRLEKSKSSPPNPRRDTTVGSSVDETHSSAPASSSSSKFPTTDRSSWDCVTDIVEHETEDEQKKIDQHEKEEMGEFVTILGTTLQLADETITPRPGSASSNTGSESGSRPSSGHKLAVQIERKPGELTLANSGRLFQRVSNLRKTLIQNVGISKMNSCYEILDEFYPSVASLETPNLDENQQRDLEDRLTAVLGVEGFELYAPMIFELRFCEEYIYSPS